MTQMVYVIPVCFLISIGPDIWWYMYQHQIEESFVSRINEIAKTASHDDLEKFLQQFVKTLSKTRLVKSQKFLLSYITRNLMYLVADLGVLAFLFFHTNLNVPQNLSIEEKISTYFNRMPSATFPFKLKCEFTMCGVNRLPEHSDVMCQSGLNFGLSILIPSILACHSICILWNSFFGSKRLVEILIKKQLLKKFDLQIGGAQKDRLINDCSKNEILILLAISYEVKADVFDRLLSKYVNSKLYQ